MYQLFIDRNENFEAKLQLEGASLKDTTCRLIIETEEWDLKFDGDINSKGEVKIPIKRLKNILNEGTSGKLLLEVLVEGDTYFQPIQEDFIAKTSKKVVAETKEPSTKETGIKITVTPSKKEEVDPIEKLTEEFYDTLIRSRIFESNVKNKKARVLQEIKKFHEAHSNIDKNILNEISKKVIVNIKKEL